MPPIIWGSWAVEGVATALVLCLGVRLVVGEVVVVVLAREVTSTSP